MGVVDEPVEDGVGEDGVADDVVPGVDGKLAGDDGGAAAVAVLEDLEQVAALGGADRRRPQSSRISSSMRAMVLRVLA